MAKDIKIEHAYPPNFEMIKAALPEANETNVYCYGDTIYVPDGHQVPPDIIFHESIHSQQQGEDPDAWWYRYVTNRSFRLEQEVQAYGEQYRWVLQHVQGGAFRKWAKESMAKALSGPEYGNLLTLSEAESRIRRYAKADTKSI